MTITKCVPNCLSALREVLFSRYARASAKPLYAGFRSVAIDPKGNFTNSAITGNGPIFYMRFHIFYVHRIDVFNGFRSFFYGITDRIVEAVFRGGDHFYYFYNRHELHVLGTWAILPGMFYGF